MKLSLEMFNKIHNAVISKKRSYHIVHVSDILLSYLSTMLSISDSIIKNKIFIFNSEDFKARLEKTLAVKSKLTALLAEIDKQSVKLDNAISRCLLHEDELRKEEEKKEEEKKKQKEALKAAQKVKA